jgi:hypothetical protein
LIDESNVLVELYKADPGHEFMHDFVFEVFNHSELLEL